MMRLINILIVSLVFLMIAPSVFGAGCGVDGCPLGLDCTEIEPGLWACTTPGGGGTDPGGGGLGACWGLSCSGCVGSLCAGNVVKIISFEPEVCDCSGKPISFDCGSDYRQCDEDKWGCFCTACRTKYGPCDDDGDCCSGLGLSCVQETPTEKWCMDAETCIDKPNPDAWCQANHIYDYCVWTGSEFTCRECKQNNHCGFCEVCNANNWCVNDPTCCTTPGETRPCSCGYNQCVGLNDCDPFVLNGVQTCLATFKWGACSVSCPASSCSVDADCVGYPCYRLVSTAASGSSLFVTDASDTASCFNDECVYNGAIYDSSINVDTWQYTAHGNPHFGVGGDTNLNIVCNAWGASSARWANADYARGWCWGVGGEWDVGFGDADVETNYYTDFHPGDPLYCNDLRVDWSGTPSLECCCGDDSGEYYDFCKFSGAVAWSGSCTSSVDACCDADDCIDTDGTCFSAWQGVDVIASGNDNIAYCGVGGTIDTWSDCDISSTRCDGDDDDCAALIPGCTNCFILTGESVAHGEYAGGQKTAECCGDDSNEYFITTNIFGTDYSACCDVGTDCVDETLACRGGTEVCDNGLDDDCDGFIDAADTDCPEGAGPNEASLLRMCIDGAEQDFPSNGFIDYDDYKCSDKCNLQLHPVTGEVMFFDNTTYNTNFFGNPYGVGFSSWDPGTIIYCCGDDSDEFYMTTLSNDNPDDDDPALHACCNESTKCVDSSGVCQIGSEEVFDLCINGLDDDCDGFIDGDDTNCTGVLQGFVFDQLGFPVAGALVKGSPAGFGPDYESMNTTLIDGSYVINNALVGTYNFIARKEGYDDNVSMTTIISDSTVWLNFTLRNGSCHLDCTDYYGNCNPGCDGLIFGTDNCNFISDLCYNVPEGNVVTYHNETTGVITEYTCCEGPIRTYPALKATVTGDVEDLYDYVINVKMGGRWVKMHILVWNPE